MKKSFVPFYGISAMLNRVCKMSFVPFYAIVQWCIMCGNLCYVKQGWVVASVVVEKELRPLLWNLC